MVKTENLTEKQKLFCHYYIEDWNASNSARRAGYSENTAGSIGSENLKKPEIKAYIDKIQDDLQKIAELSKLKVLKEHKKIAFSSIADIHENWIDLKDFNSIPKEHKDCIKKIDRKITYKPMYNEETEKMEEYMVEQIKIELYDKHKSLDSISKMLGYDSPQRVDLTTNGQSMVTGFEIVAPDED